MAEKKRDLLPGQRQPDMVDRLGDWMARNHADPAGKIGAGHAAGMFRQGVKELAQALPAFPGQGIQPVEEPGVAGNVTNMEVMRGKEQAAEPRHVGRGELGVLPAQATPAVPQQAQPAVGVQPADPLDAAREQAGRRAREQSQERQRELKP